MAQFRFDDPDQYVHGIPHGQFSKLRRESPFAWHPASNGSDDGFWLATKHQDVTAISRDPRLFATYAPLLSDPLPRNLWSTFPALSMIADSLMTFDPEKHAAFRPCGNALFTASRLSSHESGIRETCAEIMTRAFGRRQFDFAKDVALPVATQVILGSFLGIPNADLPALSRCILTINAMDDPVFRPRTESLFDAAEAVRNYGVEVLSRTRAFPNDGALSSLVHNSRLRGIPSEQVFLAYWFALAAGSFDSTASAISGGVYALLKFPDQLDLLRADPSLVAPAVDEMLRWVSPLVYFRRTATADVEFSGKCIRKGQKVVLCYASANRDESIFRRADEFDVQRSQNHHLAFGYGPHFCLGARLASLVLRVFFEEFVRQAPILELGQEVTYARSVWMSRIRLMPMRNLSLQ